MPFYSGNVLQRILSSGTLQAILLLAIGGAFGGGVLLKFGVSRPADTHVAANIVANELSANCTSTGCIQVIVGVTNQYDIFSLSGGIKIGRLASPYLTVYSSGAVLIKPRNSADVSLEVVGTSSGTVVSAGGGAVTLDANGITAATYTATTITTTTFEAQTNSGQTVYAGGGTQVLDATGLITSAADIAGAVEADSGSGRVLYADGGSVTIDSNGIRSVNQLELPAASGSTLNLLGGNLVIDSNGIRQTDPLEMNTGSAATLIGGGGAVTIDQNGIETLKSLSGSRLNVNATSGSGTVKIAGPEGSTICMFDSDAGGWSVCETLDGTMTCHVASGVECDD